MINSTKLNEILPDVNMKEEEVKKEYIVVPKGIRYVSEMGEDGKVTYRLNDYPYPHILNKVLTGCGFTEYCISNDQDMVVCSPRRLLLENKTDQHPEINVFYAKNDIDSEDEKNDYERSLTLADTRKAIRRYRSITRVILDAKAQEKVNKERVERIIAFKNRIKEHYWLCKSKNLPCKILVTYDSFRHVKEALHEIGVLSNFQVVVDEFQSILIDVKFKADTELELLHLLSDIQKVCFVSATPMLGKYLKQINEFKDLPYLEFDWEKEDPGRIIKPQIQTYPTSRITRDMTKVIYSYKEGKFEKESKINDQGLIEEVESREAVIYVNSVTLSCSLITKCELTPDQCNILIAKTADNEKKIHRAFNEVFKKLGKKDKIPGKVNLIGTVPKRGEQHKMFTFCTRTVYLGADFYSTNARTFIFCDSNVDCLSVDISMDLPQILGRQRLLENPWKNSASIYIKSTIYHLTQADFDEIVDKKIGATDDLLETFDLVPKEKQHTLADKYMKDTVGTCYRDDYVAVNRHAGSDLKPVFNQLMLVSEIRAFDIQQVDYADRVSIFNTLKDRGFIAKEVDKDLEYFNSIEYYHKKMEFLCVYSKDPSRTKEQLDMLLNVVPKSFKNYFTVLGPDKCKAHKYQKGEMEKEYQRILNNQGVSLDDRIYEAFHAGDRFTNSDIKKKLEKIYQDSGYQATAKAIDIKNWFNIKAIQIRIKGTKLKENGLELISRVTPPTP